MSKRKKPGRNARDKLVRQGMEKLNKLYQRTRKQGEKIPVERKEIEPDLGHPFPVLCLACGGSGEGVVVVDPDNPSNETNLVCRECGGLGRVVREGFVQ